MKKVKLVLGLLSCLVILALFIGCGSGGGSFNSSAIDSGSQSVYYQGVSPQVAVGRGIVPFTIQGGERGLELKSLRSQVSVSLERQDTVIDGREVALNGQLLTVKFDLNGQPVGSYDLVVRDGENTQVLRDAFSLAGSIQAAIGMAAALYEGEELIDAYVPEGTYTPETEMFPIVMLTGVNLQGPGAGLLEDEEMSRADGNAVLDAEDDSRVIEIPDYVSHCAISGLEITGGYTYDDDNGGGIYQYTNEYFQSNIAIIDNYIHDNYTDYYGGGISIENFNEDIPEPLNNPLTINYNIIEDNEAWDYGGGIYIDKEYHTFSHEISHNRIAGNEVYTEEGGGEGGGLYIYSDNYNEDYYVGITTINCNTFDQNYNYDGYGGAVYIDWLGEHVDLYMEGNTFTDNTEVYEGGGAYVYGMYYGGICRIADNTFTGNGDSSGVVLSRQGGVEGYGGGLYIDDPSYSIRNFILNNTFTGNFAYYGGGGAYIYYFDECQLSMTGNTFNGNFADTEDGYGGGVYVDDPEEMQGETYHNNTFYQNQAYCGGGLYFYDNDDCYTTFSANAFNQNYAQYGGGLYLEYIYTVTLVNGNTFSQNTALYDGGGLYYEQEDYGQYELNGNIFHGNTANDGDGGAIYLDYVYGNIPGTNKMMIALNKIYNNTADTTNGSGYGGGIYIDSIGSGDLVIGGSAANQNDIYNNTATTGQGAQLYNDDDPVDATYNYWGGGAPAVPADVYGDVDVTTSPYSTTPLP